MYMILIQLQSILSDVHG